MSKKLGRSGKNEQYTPAKKAEQYKSPRAVETVKKKPK